MLNDYVPANGKITLASGSASFTTSGAELQTRGFRGGDQIYVTAAGKWLIISSIDGENAGTLAFTRPADCAVEDGPLYVRRQADPSRTESTVRQFFDQIQQGLLLDFDKAGTLAARDQWDNQPAGFKFMRVDVVPFEMYVKKTDTEGDWSGAATYTGPKGDTGDAGAAGADGDITWEHAWVTATAYTANQAVSEAGSSYVCVEDHTSDTFATDLAAGKWELMAQKGDKGDGGDPGSPGAPGQDGLGVPAGGTEGQVLSKASATDNDTEWIDPPASGVTAITAGTGISVDSTDPATPVVTAKSMVVRTQVFSASGTYTPNANMLFCVIEAVGAGGGGGGVVGTAGSVGIGSGGGAGGYSRTTASKSTIGSSKGVTIGAGGTGGAGTSAAVAGSGGDTSVATLCIAKGGGGGQAAKGDTRYAAKGGVGGAAGTGDFTASGEAGSGAFAASISTVMAFSGGTGGSGMFGTGGPPVFNNDGGAGTGYGAGGGGALQTTTANQIGGAGASGVAIITEYCSE